MKEYEELIEAFKIFMKYPHSSFMSAEHDEVWAGPNPYDVTEEDRKRLDELGWSDFGDDGFHHFT